MNQSVEIICIGNELLIGKTLNTNAQWLAKRITILGLIVQRISVIGDNINEISNAIKESIHRNPRFLLTTGGLGPTFDDKTLEGLAKALGHRITINEEAMKMIKDNYLNYAKEGIIEVVELTPHRVKMAKFPEGAKALPNPIGTAPAVSLEYKNVIIFALPGVPLEMKSIFEESIADIMKNNAVNTFFFETSIITTNIMESVVAPLIEEVMRNNPHVYIKSHPKGTERIPKIEFHLSIITEDFGTAKKQVNTTLSQLMKLIREKGGTIKSRK